MNTESKLKGSLYGLIWGDVLGCPVETWKEQEISEIYGTYNELPASYPLQKIKQWDGRRVKRLRPLGLYSDDGQQALALIHTALQPKGWHVMNWRNVLVNGMEKRAWRGIGGFFTKAVTKMQQGVRTDQAGSHSAGIGSAMRIGPLGAIYHDDIETLRKVALESSLMTHADIRSATFSYLVAFTVFSFINGKTPEEITAVLTLEAKKTEEHILSSYRHWNIDLSGKHQVSEGVEKLLSEPVKNLQETRENISSFAKPYLAEGFSKAHPNQGFVLTGGFHALAVALQKEISSPNDALFDIIRLGYDTDTVAAIAGSMLGARFGEEWIDKSKLLNATFIEETATSLVTRQSSPEILKRFISNEASLTKKEKEFQDKL